VAGRAHDGEQRMKRKCAMLEAKLSVLKEAMLANISSASLAHHYQGKDGYNITSDDNNIGSDAIKPLLFPEYLELYSSGEQFGLSGITNDNDTTSALDITAGQEHNGDINNGENKEEEDPSPSSSIPSPAAPVIYVDSKDAKIEELGTDLKTFKEKATDLGQKLDTTTKELTSVKSQLTTVTKENEELATTSQQLAAELSKIREESSSEAAQIYQELATMKAQLTEYQQQEEKRNLARIRRKEDAQKEQITPVQQYIELLASKEDVFWKDWLLAMGTYAEVPELFRTTGKIRNKNMTKRDTEKTVKELWKERLSDPAVANGTAPPFPDFVHASFRKKVGIQKAVVEVGYNFLYSLWKYSWDTDCDLFLKVLLGDMKEDVFLSQIGMQQDLEELFDALDKAGGKTTGTVSKTDLRVALHSFFRVGEPWGKTVERYEMMLAALDQDQPGEIVTWKAIFAEDREFNQGAFAETTREQFLQERIEYLATVEEALAEETKFKDTCTRQQVVNALLSTDPDLPQELAESLATSVFSTTTGIAGTSAGANKAAAAAAAAASENAVLTIKAVMRKLSKGMIKKAATIVIGGSTTGNNRKGGGGGGASGAGGGGGTKGGKNSAIMRALEAVRQEWIRNTLGRSNSSNQGGTVGDEQSQQGDDVEADGDD
jgi:regulator of replication initiation timing